ncbi:MAG: polysaccharide biosynthesis tyrosine autokinase [Rhodococcus sp. (in: high G+C Gram-positive bacteria)]|nr:polysaccharide biosynthesis tyrosine autokinase [Rhodococcus sp. (in: high G+C Gram-positive bacteria)]
MEIREYWRILRAGWWIVALATVIGVAGAYAYTFFTTPQYQACARLFVTTEGGSSVGEAYQNNLFSQERVSSYAGLATSTQVAQRAVDQLQLQGSAAELRSRITATPIEKTVLLDLCATDADPAVAQALTNAVAGQLTQVVQELETSQRGGDPAAGATIVDQGDVPSDPIGMGLFVALGLGGAVGFVVGLALALLRGLVDRSIRDRPRAEDVSGRVVLGGLPVDGTRPTVAVASMATMGEPLRILRTNIRFLGGGSPPRVITITSAASGEGRTSTAIDLSAVLAEAGHTVLLVGGDLRSSTLGTRLGIEQDSGLSTVLSGEHSVEDAIQKDVFDGVSVLPSGPVPPNPSELLGSDRAQELLKELRADYRYVIVDTPPLLEVTDGAILTALSDGTVVLARTGRTTRDKLRRAIKALDGVGGTVLGVVTTFEPSGSTPPRWQLRNLRRLQRNIRCCRKFHCPGHGRSSVGTCPLRRRPAEAGNERLCDLLGEQRIASMSGRWTVRVGVLVTAAVVSISCSQQAPIVLPPGAPTAPVTAAPVTSAPPPPSNFGGTAPGSLISAEPIEDIAADITELGATATRVVYRSTSGVTGEPTDVSGTVVIPGGTAPDGGLAGGVLRPRHDGCPGGVWAVEVRQPSR